MLLATALLTAPLTTYAPALPQDREALLSLEHRGLDALLPDPRDAGLLAGLDALLARLDGIEQEPLLRELAGEDIPDDLLWVLARALHGPLRMSLAIDPDPIPGMHAPLVTTLTAPTADAASARQLDRRLHAFLLELGAPAVPRDGGWHTDGEEPPAWWGPRDAAWEFHLGARREHVPLSPSGLPQGARRAFAADFRLGSFLEHTGLAGEIGLPDDLATLLASVHLQVEIGSSADAGFVSERFVGLAAKLAERGVVLPRTLTAADLRPIPADATWAWATTVHLPSTLRFLDQLVSTFAGYGDGPLRATEKEFGFDPIEDLAAHLGDVCGLYASDTTGGGGLLSTVAFASVRDADALDVTIDRLLALAHEGLAQQTSNRLQVRSWERLGARFDTLVAAGWPVPAELTLARTGGHILFAATPQAALAAVEHLRSEQAGLAGRADFAPTFAATIRPHAAAWIDVPALLPRGYGFATLGASALANFANADTLVLPPLAELARDARPLIQITTAEGGDLVSRTTHDRSWMTTLTGVAGLVDAHTLMLGGFLFGVAWSIPVATTVIEARLESAEQAKVRADLVAINQALTQYLINNGGVHPKTLEVLVAPDLTGARYLNALEVPKDPWGVEYMYAPPDGDKPYRIYTQGADGLVGGEGEDRDLSHLDVLDGR